MKRKQVAMGLNKLATEIALGEYELTTHRFHTLENGAITPVLHEALHDVFCGGTSVHVQEPFSNPIIQDEFDVAICDTCGIAVPLLEGF